MWNWHYQCDEVCDHVSEDDSIVCFNIEMGHPDVTRLPQLVLVVVHLPGRRPDVH